MGSERRGVGLGWHLWYATVLGMVVTLYIDGLGWDGLSATRREQRIEKKLDAIMDHLGISEAAPDER